MAGLTYMSGASAGPARQLNFSLSIWPVILKMASSAVHVTVALQKARVKDVSPFAVESHLSSLTSIMFHWSKPITRPAPIQGVINSTS